jgi:hypothetical protein
MRALFTLPLLMITLTGCEQPPEEPGTPRERDPHEGIQVGEEEITAAPDPCSVEEVVVAIDEPALDGLSAADLLEALQLEVTLTPTWFDGAEAELVLHSTWTGGSVTHVVVHGADESCEDTPRLDVPMTTTIASSDGRLDEVFEQTFHLIEGLDQSVGEYLPFDGLAGTLDIDEAVSTVAGMSPPFNGEISAFWSWKVEGDPHGTIEVVAWPGESSSPNNILDVIEFPIASW